MTPTVMKLPLFYHYDERGRLVVDDVYNGFDDRYDGAASLRKFSPVSKLPDPTISTADEMKAYSYA